MTVEEIKLAQQVAILSIKIALLNHAGEYINETLIGDLAREIEKELWNVN